jgi:hypothetical protein
VNANEHGPSSWPSRHLDSFRSVGDPETEAIASGNLHVRVARQNEAARAADAAAWVRSAPVVLTIRYIMGHKEVPVTHLRKMMLEEFQRRHYSEGTTRYSFATLKASHGTFIALRIV